MKTREMLPGRRAGEHARIFWFRQGGKPAVFFASADFMNRNLSKRVELLTPVEVKEARKRLQHILETHFADTARGRVLKSDGTWHIAYVTAAKAVRSQEQFAREMTKRARQANESPDVRVPHTPK